MMGCSIDVKLPGGWCLSFELGFRRTWPAYSFYTAIRKPRIFSAGYISQAFFYMACGFAWCEVLMTKVT